MPLSAAAKVVALAALMAPSRARAQLRARVTGSELGNASTNLSCGGREATGLLITVTGTSRATRRAGSYSGVLATTIVPN